MSQYASQLFNVDPNFDSDPFDEFDLFKSASETAKVPMPASQRHNIYSGLMSPNLTDSEVESIALNNRLQRQLKLCYDRTEQDLLTDKRYERIYFQDFQSNKSSTSKSKYSTPVGTPGTTRARSYSNTNNNNNIENNANNATDSNEANKEKDQETNTAQEESKNHKRNYVKGQKKIEREYMVTLMDNLEEYKTAFSRFAHGQDKLSLNKLGLLLRYLGLNPTESQIEDLKNEVDEDQNGVLDMHEFVNLVQDQFASKDNDEDLLLLAFSQIDTSQTGSMSLEDIRRAIEQCKPLITCREDQDKLRALLITREKNTYSKNDPDVPKLSRIEKLKKFISKVIAFFRNTEEENDPNEQNKKQSSSSKSNMHGYGRHSSHYMRDGYESHESNNSRNCSRRASEISRDSDKERLLDDKKTKSDGEEGKEHEETWLTKKEIEEMVREFDIEGQGRFDTNAFIKAWKQLNSDTMNMKDLV